MSTTTKLFVWNAALREIASAPLTSTTDANTRQFELNAAWDHAVDNVLAMEDWGFARRRSSLTGSSDTSFPPYVYRFTKPSDYLRKCWFKASASDEAEVDHAEIAAVFYAMASTALLEYVSDTADNYDPANWPPHFIRVVTLHLAALVAPKLARAGAGDAGMLDGKLQTALSVAREQEALFLTNTAIAANRIPVMRRAIEFLGQQLAGSVAIHGHTNMLRWHMNRSWDHAVKYVLEQGAWNFATRRILLTGGTETVPGGETLGDIIEGYSFGPATEDDADDLPDVSGWDYGFLLPDDFLHKIWIKADANHDMECRHQFMRNAVYASTNAVVLEYVALDADSTDPEQWTANFLEVVAAYLAFLVCPSIKVDAGGKGKPTITANEIRDKMERMYLTKLSDAKLRDAIQQEPKRLPLGRFARARIGSTWSTQMRRDN